MNRVLFASLLFLSSWAQAAASIVLLPGTSPQTAVAFSAFANPIQARVVDDASGVPMPGVRVEYRYNTVGLVPDPQSACVLDDMGLCYASSDSSGFIHLPSFKPIHVGTWPVAMFLESGRIAAIANGLPVWFSMPAGAWTDANTWKGPVYLTTGAMPLGPTYDWSRYRATKVGDFTLRFSDTGHATFDYAVEGHVGTQDLIRFEY